MEDKYKFTGSILLEHKKELNSKEYLVNKELSYEMVEDGTVLPLRKGDNPFPSLFGAGGVLTETGTYVENSAQLGFNMMNRVYGSYKTTPQEVDIVHKKVIYVNYFKRHWGHYLLDVIGRLWFTADHIEDYYYVYTTLYGETDVLSGNYLEFFKLLGISEDKLIRVNKPTRFDVVIVPESSIFPGKYYTKEYKNIFDKVISSVDITGQYPIKVYCSRKDFGPAIQKESGETIIEKIFNENGYVSIHMEALSLAQQIDLINSSEEIAAISGTLPHNLLFDRKKNNFVILNKTYLFNSHQYFVNEITGAHVVDVDVYVSPLPVTYGNGPFIIRVTPELCGYCNKFGLSLGFKSNTRLDIIEKLKYYLSWAWINKRFVLKNGLRFQKFDRNINYKALRDYYKAQQNY